ncbi:MAG TPA: patatin-like phospholipase family protein, partial [Burkholderiales bacterium]|nr:patatin-like phospholipase family protein [Burkholderiales bacterium]
MKGRNELRVGLALGSGAARGWAHIGVIQTLERHGISPDIVCGTSIGALVG